MRLSFVNIFSAASLLLLSSLFASCDKVDVNFGNVDQTSDPAITYFSDYQVSLQTMQVDSFLTSAANTFTVGYHSDPVFGTIHAGSYAQITLPASNPVLGQQVSSLRFDSLRLVLTPKGNYYGDTTQLFNIKVYQLTELIQNSLIADNNFYNKRSFNYDSVNPLGQQSIVVKPGNGSSFVVKLSDAVGIDLLNKFQAGASQVSTQTDFVNYFKGVYIDADQASTNSLYTFTTASTNVVMRLYYTQTGVAPIAKTIDFAYTASRQFSHIDYDRGNSFLSGFPLFVNNVALKSSDVTGSKAYLNSSTGSYIKISFPNLLTLKTLHPYVKVLSAQLIIPPSPGTYTYPYKLPAALYLYETDKNNGLLTYIIDAGGSPATGNLFIDNLYGQSTQYTYDVTSFITGVINQGISSTAALILAPEGSLGDQSLSRLVINDQNLVKGIQLKLYVLGI